MKIILLIVALFYILYTCQAIEFDLPTRNFKCFEEELPANFDVYGEYSAEKSVYGQIVEFRVTDPEGVLIIDRENIESSDFSFLVKKAGDYSFCFYNRLVPGVQFHESMKRRLSFDVLTGTETFDYRDLARKEHLKPIEINLRMMEDIVKEVYTEFLYFNSRATEMERTSKSIYRRVWYLTLTSILIAFGFAVGQIFYLKRFFIKRKILRTD
mmetsp:Transcript_2583/g.3729  ORF Transcript_2583/g.3729 Transcript_2583/m.3729 type:complete len:212 (-) Transcript_2583:780-1415(-)